MIGEESTMLGLVAIVVLAIVLELICDTVWAGRRHDLKKREELRSKGLISLKELIETHPPEKHFRDVYVYRKFIDYAYKTFGKNWSKIFMTPRLFSRLVNFMTDCGYSTWVDWLNFKIHTNNYDLKDCCIEFRIDKEGYGLIEKI